MKESILLDAWIPFILLFLKNCYGRFKINTRCYTCREQILQKKMTMCKKDDRSAHQNSIKVPYFQCK